MKNKIDTKKHHCKDCDKIAGLFTMRYLKKAGYEVAYLDSANACWYAGSPVSKDQATEIADMIDNIAFCDAHYTG